MNIRIEEEGDAAQIRVVIAQAFARSDEARLVERLRREAGSYIGIVAVGDASVVGHVAFTAVTIEGWDRHPPAAGLAPLAVAPMAQHQGVGAQLVRAGLATCRERGFSLVVVLGDPQYYARFGFVPASEHGLGNDYDAPAGAFRVIELMPGALRGAAGTVHYHPAFDEVSA